MIARRKVRARRAAAIFGAAAATAAWSGAWATGGTWTYAADASWSNSQAWQNGLIAEGVGEIAAFGRSGFDLLDVITVSLDSSRTIGSMLFRDSDTVSPAGWRLAGSGSSVLSLQSAAGEYPSITVNTFGGPGTLAQHVAHINAPIAGTEGFVRRGTGTLILSGDNSGLSGPIHALQGVTVLNHAAAVGSSSIALYAGQLAFRGDSSTNFGTSIELRGDSTFGTGNSIGFDGLYGTGGDNEHTIGNVDVATVGHRMLGISGSNGYGLKIGRLGVVDGITLINQGSAGTLAGAGDTNGVNGRGSGLVTIGSITYGGADAGVIELGGQGSMAGNITVSSGIFQSGAGAVDLVYSGGQTLTLNGAIGSTGNVAVTGNGVMIVNSGALPAGKGLTVSGGTLLLNGGAVAHSVNGVTMGGASVESGSTIAHIDLGSGSLALGGNVVVNSSPGGSSAVIAGPVNLVGGARTIAVTGAGDTLAIDGPITGGRLIKTGLGTLSLNGASTYTGSLDFRDGSVIGTVQGAGNPFALVYISNGGVLGIKGTGAAGTGTIGTVTFKDTGVHTALHVDASGGGTTTLNIGSFGGREIGTQATLKIVPVTGQLNSAEVVTIQSGAPAITNGMLPAWMTVQSSGTNTQLTFGSLSGNNVVGFDGYVGSGTTAIAAALPAAVFDQTAGTGTIDPGGQTLFGLRIGAGASVAGSTLTLSSGVGNARGLILNGGARLDVATLNLASGEGVIWSGGSARNTIASNFTSVASLTTAGAAELEITGSLPLNGARMISVTGATVTFSTSGAIGGGSLNSITKRGGGVMAVGGDHALSGQVVVDDGTLQIGTGASGSIAIASIANNSNVVFFRNNAATFTNSINGSGNVWVDGSSTGVVTLGGALSYSGSTGIKRGTLKINADNRLPTGTALRVDGDGTFDLSGFRQTVSSLSGFGTITNSGTLAGVVATLTVGGSGTFDGAIRNSASGSVSLAKNTPGTLVLTNPSSNFTGTISLNNGAVLEVRDGNAAGNSGTLTLANATLIANNNTNREIRRNIVIPAGSTGTISVLAKPDPAGWNPNFQYIQDGQATVNGLFAGTGTLVLDLKGRQLDIGTFASATALLDQFTGTVVFPDSNPVGSKLRLAMGVNQFTAGNSSTTWNFGNGFNIVNFRNGSTVFNMGYVSGGTNTILQGCENGAGRLSTMQMGARAGNQTFHGMIRDGGGPLVGGFSPVGLIKTGATSSLTLTNAHSYSGPTSIQAGTLILASGSDLGGSSTITIAPTLTSGLQTATLVFNGGTISGSRRIVNIGATVNTGTQSASGALVVPNGFVTPAGTTFVGGGTVYGNLVHSTGSISPSAGSSPATLTFANSLQLSGAGNLDFDLGSGSANVMGGGVNDLVRVQGNNGLNLGGGRIRLNFTSGLTGVEPGQYYPLIEKSGTVGGSLGSVEVLALWHGSMNLVQGTGSLSNTLGAEVVSVGGPTASLTWAPQSGSSLWDIVGAKNFKPTGGSGSLLFFNGDSVTFDDSTTVRTVELGASGFVPASITVNTSGYYTFAGSGTITGPASLVKNGTGTLEIRADNSFTGGATINGGVIVQNGFTRFDPLANGTIEFNNDTGYAWTAPVTGTALGPTTGFAIINGNLQMYTPNTTGVNDIGWSFQGAGTVTVMKPDDTEGNITFSGPMESFAGTLRVADNSAGGVLRLNSTAVNANTLGPSMTLDLGNGSIALTHRNSSAPINIGALLGGPNTAITGNGDNELTVGTKNIPTTFQGTVTGTSLRLIKVGNATLMLTGAHTYGGQTQVDAGTLALVHGSSNTLASRTISIGSGGVLNIAGLNNGAGGLVLNANQTLISNGNVVGGLVVAAATSTMGGTRISNAMLLDGSTFSPGNSVGTFTADTLTLGATQLIVELDQSGMDRIVVAQPFGLTITSNVPTTLVNLGGAQTGTFTLLDYSGNSANYPGLETLFDLPDSFFLTPQLVHNTVDTRLELVLTNTIGQWFSGNSGSWSTAGQWTLDGFSPSAVVPNSVTFGSFVTSPITVSPSSAGNSAPWIIFDTPSKVTIANTGTVILSSLPNTPVIDVRQGNHAILAPVQIDSSMEFAIAPSSSLTFAGTVRSATSPALTKTGGGTAVFSRLDLRGGTFNVAGGNVVMSPKPTPNSLVGRSIVSSLSIAAGASLDLTNDALVIDYSTLGSTLTQLREELLDGRLFSSSAVAGTRIGYRNNTDSAPGSVGMNTLASFAGAAVDASSVLVRVTYAGDTNLDGIVNVLDLVNLAIAWQGMDMTWQNGDFNYDGIVNAADLGLLAGAWQNGVGNPLPSGDLASALTAAGIPLSAIPEPAGLTSIGLFGLFLRRRNRSFLR